MKKSISFIIGFIGLGLASCVDYSDEATAISAKIQVVAPQEFTAGGNLSGRTVTLSNATGATYTATTDARGVAAFDGMTSDVYNVSTAWDIDAQEYAAATGQPTPEGYFATISGSLNNQLVKSEEPVRLATNLVAGASLLIGKVYYGGSKDNNNKNYLAGRYLEIYNQTNGRLDVAGLYIGMIETNSTPAYTLDNLHTAYADSVVMLKQIFRIPTDKPYMVNPGQAIVVTNSAIDHTANGPMEQDLSKADFEAKNEKGGTINNPNVPALLPIVASGNINFVQGGPCGIVIFRTGEDPKTWPLVYKYGATKGQRYTAMPKRFIIDGVDILRNKTTGVDVSTKRLYADIDAGYAVVQAITGYTGEVIYRKTAQRRGADGHRMLQDSNNSLNDFKISTTIKTREYDD